MSSALQTVLRGLKNIELIQTGCCAKEKECYHRLPHPRFSFLVSVVYSSYFRHFSSLDSVMYSDMHTHCHLYTSDCDDGPVHVPSARGRAELRAGAAVVAIDV